VRFTRSFRTALTLLAGGAALLAVAVQPAGAQDYVAACSISVSPTTALAGASVSVSIAGAPGPTPLSIGGTVVDNVVVPDPAAQPLVVNATVPALAPGTYAVAITGCSTQLTVGSSEVQGGETPRTPGAPTTTTTTPVRSGAPGAADLPRTGSSVSPQVAVALVLLSIGVVALGIRRSLATA
jgi:hypothetical protein